MADTICDDILSIDKLPFLGMTRNKGGWSRGISYDMNVKQKRYKVSVHNVWNTNSSYDKSQIMNGFKSIFWFSYHTKLVCHRIRSVRIKIEKWLYNFEGAERSLIKPHLADFIFIFWSWKIIFGGRISGLTPSSELSEKLCFS